MGGHLIFTQPTCPHSKWSDTPGRKALGPGLQAGREGQDCFTNGACRREEAI